MTCDDFPPPAPSRPLWLMTLADLALLLVGFLVLVQATQLDRRSLARGLREGFGAAPPPPEPIAVAAAGMSGFAPASASLPASPEALLRWSRDALRDPRVSLRIEGATDGTAGDVDLATGSATLLAGDRARAVAAALAPIAAGRMMIATANTRRRQVLVTLSYTGSR